MSAWGNTDALASKPKVEARKVTFDGSSASVVNTTAETIEIRGYGFETGDALVYATTGGAIGNLTSGTTYYAIRVDSDTIKLADSYANAIAGTARNLSAVGTGTTHTLQRLAADVYGVDKNEIAANRTQEGAAHVGWNRVREVGSRKIVETLVAMSKNFAASSDLEDVMFEDALITIATQPTATKSAVAGAAIVNLGTVVATVVPTTATLTYQWQHSTDGGTNYSNINPAGGVFTGADTATLGVNSGMTDTSSTWNAAKFRCVVSSTGADSVTSSAVTLTVTP